GLSTWHRGRGAQFVRLRLTAWVVSWNVLDGDQPTPHRTHSDYLPYAHRKLRILCDAGQTRQRKARRRVGILNKDRYLPDRQHIRQSPHQGVKQLRQSSRLRQGPAEIL